MNSLKYKLALPAFLLLITIAVQAQQRAKFIDSIGNKINLYGIKNQSPLLFVHFDKTVYSNNENVWFTAYLLNCADKKSFKTLSLELVRDYDRSVVMDSKFVIKDGLTFGNAFVPDSVGPGNYSFIAYANRMANGRLNAVFTQPVTIKAGARNGFKVSLNPIDTSLTAKEQKVMLLVNFSDSIPPAAVPVSYYVGKSSYPVLKGSVRTRDGQYVFKIPSNLLSQGNNRLHVQLRYQNEVKDVSILLPVPQPLPMVRFYPEGGNLVNNTRSTVGLEIKNVGGTPLKASAILYQDKTPIDTLQTNNYGIGKFQLTPRSGFSYYIKLYGNNRKDTLYKLPAAITHGPVVTLQQALVNDTLQVTLRDGQPETLYLLVHNYKRLLYTLPVIMNAAEKKITIKLDELPKGLAQLTLTDSTGRPFAQRMFFAHYNKKTSLTIAADKNEYTTRQKVKVKVKLNGIPDSGSVSIACVQENRIELNKQSDIESYVYLNHELDGITSNESYLTSSARKQYLEDILLVKGWTRYTWADVLKMQRADILTNYSDVLFKGIVTRKNKRLKLPVELFNPTRTASAVTTNATGEFILKDADLLVEPDKNIGYVVKDKHPEEYEIRLADPYPQVNKFMATQLKAADYNIPALENTEYMKLARNEQGIQLKEVQINDNNGSFYGMDICSDYVCPMHYLNCPKDKGNPANTKPVIGEKYIVYMRGYYTYSGCMVPNESVLQFKGIYKPVEFYATDYSHEDAPPQDYQSTIYWKHQLKVSSDRYAEFSFYTSDITGKFKIIVQGATGNDVTYGEASFNVVKAK